jgi:AraC-like DNA-binding protein
MLFYREIEPTVDTSHLVLSFWEFTVGSEMLSPLHHEVLPDGCVSIFYCRNDRLNSNKLITIGLNLESIKTTVLGGSTYWGMRLSPAASAKVLRCQPSAIESRPVDTTKELLHLTENLLAQLNACQNFTHAVAVYESLLKRQHLKSTDADKKVAKAVRIIEAHRGEIKIATLAREVNLSTRQLERRFRQSSGLTPKQYARARRIRAMAISLVTDPALSLARRAATMGFTDQSHLTHEFVSLTGRSLKSFADKVKQIEYGNLIT